MIWPQVEPGPAGRPAPPRLLGRDRRRHPRPHDLGRPSSGCWRRKRPRYYVTQVTAPTLTNDMCGAFLARSLGARTIAFGTHVTPMPRETMEAFPALDFVLRGEPELTLRELIDTLETRRWANGPAADAPSRVRGSRPALRWDRHDCARLYRDADPDWQPAWRHLSRAPASEPESHQGPGLARRRRPGPAQPRPALHPQPGRPAPAAARPAALGQVPRARHRRAVHLCRHQPRLPGRLPLLHQARQLRPRGARPLAGERPGRAAGCCADLGAAQRPHVRRPVHRQPRAGDGHLRGHDRATGCRFRWTCNSRVDFVDPEMLQTDGAAPAAG